MSEIQSIKQRFGIIGTSPLLERAIDIARQVAPTDLTVLITGESGTGKEVFSKIIHQYSSRKHQAFIAVNCGAIPEGTIDSELFGHEKGAFTSANDARKGYFEVANGGTIFLDEVAELPLSTQVRLLRVLESGEYLRVGSSKIMKTDVRIVAATNVNLSEAIANGKFREDLFYRLNTVPISMPALRQRKDDITLLFRKFASDTAEKYKMPMLELTPESSEMLKNYKWSGNVRQLKNIAEQISVLEQNRLVTPEVLQKYLSERSSDLPVLYRQFGGNDNLSERDLLYKVLFDMKKDMTDMKKLIAEIISATGISHINTDNLPQIIDEVTPIENDNSVYSHENKYVSISANDDTPIQNNTTFDYHEEIEENFSLEKKEREMIIKALEKYGGRRKNAAVELGISERTLYRKIKEYDINQ